jgi:hypothetical protein
MFFIYGIAAFLAAGIIPTVLIITFYEKKPINPYLPALVVWLLGFLIHANGMVRSMMFNVDPFGQVLALSVMAITVISSVISWVIAEIWTRNKNIVKMKLRRLVITLNILAIIVPLLFMFITKIIFYAYSKILV